MWLKALTPVRYAPGKTAQEGQVFEVADDAAAELLGLRLAEEAEAPVEPESQEKTANPKTASAKK